jgi:hypothetical protein
VRDEKCKGYRYRNLAGKLEGKRPLRNTKNRWRILLK